MHSKNIYRILSTLLGLGVGIAATVAQWSPRDIVEHSPIGGTKAEPKPANPSPGREISDGRIPRNASLESFLFVCHLDVNKSSEWIRLQPSEKQAEIWKRFFVFFTQTTPSIIGDVIKLVTPEELKFANLGGLILAYSKANPASCALLIVNATRTGDEKIVAHLKNKGSFSLIASECGTALFELSYANKSWPKEWPWATVITAWLNEEKTTINLHDENTPENLKPVFALKALIAGDGPVELSQLTKKLAPEFVSSGDPDLDDPLDKTALDFAAQALGKSGRERLSLALTDPKLRAPVIDYSIIADIRTGTTPEQALAKFDSALFMDWSAARKSRLGNEIALALDNMFVGVETNMTRLQAMPISDLTQYIQNAALVRLANHDPVGLSMWAATAENSEFKDAAIYQLVEQLKRDPAAQEQWINQISNDQLRNKASIFLSK
jgi:hypothetical protein